MSRKVGLSLLLIIVLVGAALGGLAFTHPQAIPSGEVSRTITVVGQGKVNVKPDVARAQIGVEVFAPTVKEATTKNREQMMAVQAALLKVGVAEKDIQTSNYSINFEQNMPIMMEPGIKGSATTEPQGRYRVSNMVEVVIRDLDNIGAILDAAVEAGANSIWGVSFGLEDSSAAESEARAKAMANARAKAAELAKLAGVTLGDVVSVSEIIGGSYPIVAFAAEVRGFGGSVPISPGELSIQTQLQVAFAVK